jgi:hypothetical protein
MLALQTMAHTIDYLSNVTNSALATRQSISSVVTMPFDENIDIRMLRKEGFVISDGWPLAWADSFVIVEEHTRVL